jgi:mycofactocin system transcriptional regulator
VARDRGGRPPATSRIQLERIGLDLFARKGFTATTINDIAAAAGVGRRTFFRYYASKNDVVWGDFSAGLREMAADLAAAPRTLPLSVAVTEAVCRFNALPPEAVEPHRQRMELILRVPALQAHSTLRYAEWRQVVAEFAAARLGVPVRDLRPQLTGHVALAAALTAYEQWLDAPAIDLQDLLLAAFARVRAGLDGSS